MQITDGRTSFYQWDLNVTITDKSFVVGDEIHFSNKKTSKALVVSAYLSDTKVVADVPNILLQQAMEITAYRYVTVADSSYTTSVQQFEVEKRQQPEDYVYTETELVRVEDIVNAALLEAKESGEFDGLTPYIGDNGNWWIGDEDTGINAEVDASKFVPRMAELGDTLAEEYLGNKYHRLYCERNRKDIDGDGTLDERGTYARICITEIPIPPPDPDIYAEDADPALLEAYEAKQYGEHISLHSVPLRTNHGDLRVPARTVEEAEALDPNNAKEFALSIYGAKKAFVPKMTCPDKNRYVYTVTMNSKGESVVSLIKTGANVPSSQDDLNAQHLIRRRVNGAVSTRKIPEADDDACSKYYADILGDAILEGLDAIITAQNELLGG